MNSPVTKYKGKYRISSNRLPEWDYGTPGYYFVTICTHNRVSWFGEIKEDQMTLSWTGKVVKQNLERIPHIYPNVSLDAWVVMPNHIHGIIVIGPVETFGGKVETPYYGVSTNTHKSKPETLGVILSRYKFSCTKSIHRIGYEDFAWQRNYFDHIIRNEKSLDNIRAYIFGNPIKWAEDEYF